MKSQEWRDCSEQDLEAQVRAWVQKEREHLQNAIVFLEGEMGAGKSTFARAMLSVLSPEQISKGSPTFPIVQEYPAHPGKIYHIDLYRIRHDSELEDSGVLAQIEERDALALIEWSSMFPEAFEYWKRPFSPLQQKSRPKSVWQILLSGGSRPDLRNVKLTKL